jgi:hypothetical protein
MLKTLCLALSRAMVRVVMDEYATTMPSVPNMQSPAHSRILFLMDLRRIGFLLRSDWTLKRAVSAYHKSLRRATQVVGLEMVVT